MGVINHPINCDDLSLVGCGWGSMHAIFDPAEPKQPFSSSEGRLGALRTGFWPKSVENRSPRPGPGNHMIRYVDHRALPYRVYMAGRLLSGNQIGHMPYMPQSIYLHGIPDRRSRTPKSAKSAIYPAGTPKTGPGPRNQAPDPKTGPPDPVPGPRFRGPRPGFGGSGTGPGPVPGGLGPVPGGPGPVPGGSGTGTRGSGTGPRGSGTGPGGSGTGPRGVWDRSRAGPGGPGPGPGRDPRNRPPGPGDPENRSQTRFCLLIKD